MKKSLPPLNKAKVNPPTRVSSDNNLVNLNDYKLIGTINRGGFGIINLVKHKKSGEEYAAKTNLITTKSQNKKYVSREVRILSQMQHATMIGFRGFSYVDFQGEPNITILMDYMKQGSLANLIEQETSSLCPPNYDNTKRQIILVGIARGMMLLHKHCVIHRDLKPENILLDSDFHPRITDFGLSKFFDPNHSMSQSMSESGTVAYMAPEVISSDHFNTKADVYAFGILMYEVVAGRRAYDDVLNGKKKLNLFQLKTKVQNGLRPKFDFPIKKGIKKMIQQCWIENPKERPTFDELYRKLSLSNEDYFLQFEANYEEPKIPEDDDDDDGESESEFNMKYCLDDVDINELLDYVDEIKDERNMTCSRRENEELRDEIKRLSLKADEDSKQLVSKIKSLEEEISTMKKERDAKISSLEKEISTMKKERDARISSLEAEISSLKKERKIKTSGGYAEEKTGVATHMKEIDNIVKTHTSDIALIQKRLGSFFSVEKSLDKPGILYKLSEKQKSPFDRLFIVSISSNDPYSLLLDNDRVHDLYSYVEFELESPLSLNGIQIYISDYFFLKSFDISIDGKTVKSVKEAKELNGENKQMTVNFPNTKGKKIRLSITGPRWDYDKEKDIHIHIRRIELLSTDKKYSKGVFATFLKESENGDPHKCPVIIYSNFDLTQIHTLNASHCISTFYIDNSWLQIELSKGFAIINSFRITKAAKMKSYKLICTDDINKPESSWTTLIEINESREDEYQMNDTYELPHPSPPTRFIRLVQTGPTWLGDKNIWLARFEIFGCYF